MKCFFRLLENFLEAGQRCLNGIHVLRPFECQLKMMNVHGDHHKTTEDVEKKMQELIHEDHHQTIHELADTIGISYGVCQEIFTENLNMCSIAAKFAPRLLANDQKQCHVNTYLEL
jgi:hypothetical protein